MISLFGHFLKLWMVTLGTVGLLLAGTQCMTTGGSKGKFHASAATTQSEYQKMLAEYLDLPASQIRVRAEAKVTRVTFTDVTDTTHREGIVDCMETLNANNPEMNPMKWQFQ